MMLRFPDYSHGYRILSLAKSDNGLKYLQEKQLSVLYLSNSSLRIMPDDFVLSCDNTIVQKLYPCEEGDVFELTDRGELFLSYNSKSEDNAFVLTNHCNSNCIMCPSSEYSRKNGNSTSVQHLLDYLRYLPDDAVHFTITGGEPFLIGRPIFDFFSALKEKFNDTAFLLLTNGRIFSVPEYCIATNTTLPARTVIGIPVHGPNAEIHDSITQCEGSFTQTNIGIKNMLALGRIIELRIVVSMLNAAYITEIARLFVREYVGAYSVKIMGLEMLGSAAINRSKVWIPYREAFQKAKEAIKILISNGFDVQLYNFPLCSVDQEYWNLCAKSITEDKVRYPEKCSLCKMKDACGGMFAGTYNLAKNDVAPIQEEPYDLTL